MPTPQRRPIERIQQLAVNVYRSTSPVLFDFVPSSTLARPLAAFLLLCAACVSPPPEDPAEATRAFLDHLRSGEAAQAWALLTPGDRERLRAREKTLAEAEGRPPETSPESLLVSYGLQVRAEPEHVRVASRLGETVKVRATTEEGRSATFVLKRGGPAGWWIDLEATLVPTSTAQDR